MCLRLITFFSLFILFNIIYGQSQSCKSDKACNEGAVECGFCVNSYCNFPFVDIYTPGKSCKLKTDKCKKQSCQVWQLDHSPIEGYSGCVCECPEGRYGKYCEKEGVRRVTYPSGVQLIAPTAVRCLEYYNIFIIIHNSGSDGKKFSGLKLELKTSYDIFGSTITEPVLHNIKTEEAKAFCLKHSWDPRICRFFKFRNAHGVNLIYVVPLRMPLFYPVEWSWSNQTELSMSGLTYNLTLNVTSNGLFLATYEQQFVVSYSNVHQSQAAIPKIFNCGDDIEYPMIYHRSQEIYLKSLILFPIRSEDGLRVTLEDIWNTRKKINFEWMALRVVNPQTIYLEHDVIGGNFWRVPSFSLIHGLYIMRLNTRTIDLVKTDNYGQCYLKVELEPLMATISGGLTKAVNIKYELILDPSGSRDPNQPWWKNKLRFTMACNWTAEDICKPRYRENFLYQSGLQNLSFHYSPKLYKFKTNRVYNFTLKVELGRTGYYLKPSYASQLVTVESFPEVLMDLKSFEIECFYNCDNHANPQDIVFLKLKDISKLDTFPRQTQGLRWTVSWDNGTKNSMSFEDQQNFLIAKDDILFFNYTYDFQINFLDTNISAIYELKTTTCPKTTCRVVPSSGYKVETIFKIICNSTGFVDRYEFYDEPLKQFPGPSHVCGRQLGFQKIGVINNVVLSGDIFQVLTFGKNGVRSVDSVKIEIRERNTDSKEAVQLWHELNEMSSEHNIDELHRNSALLTYWNPEKNKFGLLTMLTWLNLVPPRTSTEAKLWASTLHYILSLVFRKFLFSFGLRERVQASSILATIPLTLLRESPKRSDRQLTFEDYNNIFKSFLNCITIVLDVGILDIILEKNAQMKKKFHFQVEKIHNHVLYTLRRIGMVNLSRRLPEQEAIILGTNFTIGESFGLQGLFIYSVVKHPRSHRPNLPLIPSLWSHLLPKNDASSLGPGPLTIPDELANIWRQERYFVGIQVTSIQNNYRGAIWWNKFILTTIIYVQVCYRPQVMDECNYPLWLETAILVTFYIKPLIEKIPFLNATVIRLNDEFDEDYLDFNMKFIKIIVPAKACLSVYFNMVSKDDELIVMVQKTNKPGYRSVERYGIVITQKRPAIHVKCQPSNRSEFYYMAIQACETILTNQTQQFQYKAISRRCITWIQNLRTWVTLRSEVMELDSYTPDKQLVCKWSRLSYFAGDVKSALSMFEEVQVMDIYFTPWSNRSSAFKYLKIYFATSMLAFFLAWWTDRRQRPKRFVIVLADNFPHEKYGYLICVKTGIHLKAGTNASVGIRLIGALGESRAHVLRSESHDVMGWGSEDWFLLFTPEHLGVLDSIHIWLSDNQGCPEWYCNLILVHDMRMDDCYTFFVNEWIGLSVTRLPEAIVSAQQDIYMTPSRRLLGHLKCGIRLSHPWVATVFRHPRDPMTRSDRLMIITCFLFLSMATSLVLLVFSEPGPYLKSKEDLPSFSVRWIDIAISLIASAVSTAFAAMMRYMFRKSYHVWYRIHTESEVSYDYFARRTSIYEQLSKDCLIRQQSYRMSAYSKTSTVKGTERGTKTSTMKGTERGTKTSTMRGPERGTKTSTMRGTERGTKTSTMKGTVRGTLRNTFRDSLEDDVMRSWLQNTALPPSFALLLIEHPLVPVQHIGGRPAVHVKWGQRCKALFLSLLIVLTSIVLCVEISDHMSPNRLRSWAFIIVLSIIFHTVIYIPLKIVIYSLILTFAFDQIIFKDFCVFDPITCQRDHLFGNPDYLRKMIMERTKPEYQPVRELTLEHRRLKRQRLMKWRKIVEFLLILIFIILLSKILNQNLFNFYVSNSHMDSMITASRDINFPSYYKIFNLTQFDDFVQGQLSFSLYRFMWYNEEPIIEDGKAPTRAFDDMHCLLGSPLFRQYRVKRDYCRFPELMVGTMGDASCAATWSLFADDKQTYKPFWLLPIQLNDSYWELQFEHSLWSEHFTANWSEISNWTYIVTDDYTYYGKSNVYQSGGYRRDLVLKSDVLMSVQDSWWVEHHTRAVLAQLTLYNVNTRLLTQFTLITEQTITGEFLTSVDVRAVNTDVRLDGWVILLMMFTILHFLKITAMFNSVGLVGYFKNVCRIYDLSLFILLLISIQNLIVIYLTDENRDEIVSSKDHLYKFYDKTLKITDTTLLLHLIFFSAVANIHFSHMWRLGHQFLNSYRAVVFSRKTISWLFFIFILFFIIFYFNMYFYSTYFVMLIFKQILSWKYPFFQISKNVPASQILYCLVCLFNLVTAILSILFLSVFTYEYKRAKKSVVSEKYSINLVTFIFKEIFSLFTTIDASISRGFSHITHKTDGHSVKSDKHLVIEEQ